jgi:hypothetical protein
MEKAPSEQFLILQPKTPATGPAFFEVLLTTVQSPAQIGMMMMMLLCAERIHAQNMSVFS